ncbi:MaoC family dehydratase N-terminal domain-containing protein [Altererythrobacter sp. MF3-039]|uniref:FAS1-like dehydratase domain-containing protein n=1 Tax=Altererythrobacter sp. MF3-039 TaxID=3252901 RepID=UPI00390C5778
MSQRDAWVGGEEKRSDLLDRALASRWLATFDQPSPADGIMPQGIHLCLCTPDARTDALGIDGHPSRDDSSSSFFPPIPLPRRMWASSRIEFLSPLKVGAKIERTSRIVSVSEKEGSTGKLGFVDVEHVTRADGTETIREVQTLVYRDAMASDAPLSPPAPGDGSLDSSEWDTVQVLTPSEVLLFRYSALTFNTHRIHYDLPYARDAERYRGLVVHGPLIASLLLQLAAREVGENALKSFAFRAVSPAIALEPLHLVMRGTSEGIEMGSFASDGRQTLKATATL